MSVVGHGGKAVALGGKMLSSPGGGGGTGDHRDLTNRDAADQHPISAITGLQNELDAKMPGDTQIPAEVTEQIVAGWGFTKNSGTYSKPSDGIPKTDLASAVQTSLGKADTAMQPGDLADWAKQANKPSYTASEVGLGNVDNVRQYSDRNPPPYPVTSVNGQTGDVAVSAGTESTTQQITLTTSGWTTSGSYKAQTVSVSGVTESTPVIFYDVNLTGTDKAADDAMLEAWLEVLKCYVAQGDGTLTFHAEAVPAVNISVKVAIC